LFLATTALTDFWKTDGPILFLGEWCLKYDERHKWKSLSYQILEYPWDDRKQLSLAIEYCNSVYESILNFFVRYMNSIHDVEYSNRYWRIILGPWLLYYIHVLYDRYICLRLAFERFPGLKTIVLAKENYITPYDYYDFHCNCADDPYNMQLFTQLLEGMGYSFPSKPFSLPVNVNKGLNYNRRMKLFFKNTYGRLLSFFTPRCPILLYDLHFKQLDVWRICFGTRFKAWPATYDGKYQSGAEKLQVRKDLRDKLRDFQSGCEDDPFKRLLFKTFFVNLPICYLEGYKIIKKFVHTLVKKAPIKIISSFGWTSNERFKILAAEASEKGTKLSGVQHGGASGINKYTAGDVHVINSADRYYTWGWTDRNFPKTTPLPDPNIQRLKDAGGSTPSFHNDMPALFVGTIFTRYLQYFRYCPLGPQVKRYISWQIRFFETLPETIRNQFIIRLHPRDFGWANKSRLSEQIDGLRFDNHLLPYQEQVKKSKLIVADNCQTTFLEAILLNRPVVLFYDPVLWDISEEAEPYMECLHQAGILHYNPVEAAKKVADVFENPGSWWHLKEVQDARGKYIGRFAIFNNNWLRVWKGEILSLLN